ncbi:type II toxin-antitoxin system RelE/ParE family toxin [Microbulbifer sp. TYP-18]|uniref:type II toxin-antitoxin system RelE/ParE family toxin n=1 Tax=Microbulbifer sp. TYP-18 TaxID=3230024 RepID=UPI0034C68188
MTYDLKFHPAAFKAWKKLGTNVRSQFKKKLEERLENPHVPKDRLSGKKDLYKIKLRAAGYRLVYHANDVEIIVTVIAIGKREKNQVYLQIE